MTFHVGGTAPVLLSLPDWTPGAYEISNFAKWVMNFSPTSGGTALDWDKLDYDTWRIHPSGAGTVTVGFDYLADTLDNAMAWAQKDFLLVNGTNVFLYPEGADLGHYPATVSVHTQPDWLIATGMTPTGGQHQYAERSYHDLVDMPFFIGKFDLDSMDVSGKLARLATYPAGVVTGAKRDSIWHDLQRIIPTEGNVIGITPWKTYNTMMIFSPTYPGGSALEHQNSHVGVYTTQLLALEPVLASITAHEMFHSWNVKRLRPADMVPYRYDRPMPTPWLWVSEGITDYYADLTLVRGGVVADSDFYNTTMGKIGNVLAVPPTALEDASLSTWIHPVDGSGYIYYPKGSLAGFLLDIMIRDASDNHHSLDQVMGQLYRSTYQQGRGFTAADWWAAVSRAAGGHSFTRFNTRYIDGREPFPYDSVLPLAGLQLKIDSTQVPRVGISGQTDSIGENVMQVTPGSSAEAAGVQAGDHLLQIGDIRTNDPSWAPRFRQEYADKEGADLPMIVQRGETTDTLMGKVRLAWQVNSRLIEDRDASAKAKRIREGILRGKMD